MSDRAANVLGESAHFPQSLLRDDVRSTIQVAELIEGIGSDVALADEIDASASSVANWRNRACDMSLYAWVKGLRRFGSVWANRILERHGYRVVEIEAQDAADAGKALGLLFGKLDYELRIALMDDGSISDRELLAIAPTIDDVGPMLDALRERLRDLRERRS